MTTLITPGVPYVQDFDTLASSGTSSAVPTGWAFFETGTNANLLYTAGTGSGNAGDTYSFGATGSTERALGGLLSGSLTPTLGAMFTNSTGVTLSSLDIQYIGEQWRLGVTPRTTADRLDFQFSLNATSLSTGTWTDVNALDFVAPILSGTVGALNGNAAANRSTVTGTIDSLTLAPGATIWIRWSDFNVGGADDGLAVDDFSLTPRAAVPPPGVNLSLSAVTGSEAAATTITATASVAEPVVGDQTVVLTVSGTGITASDYWLSNATITILSGQTSGAVTFTVNDDANPEGIETAVLTIGSPSPGLTLGTTTSGTVAISNKDTGCW